MRPSSSPESWKIGPLVEVAVGLGVVMVLEALGLLAVGLRVFGLHGGALHTFSFLTLLFFALGSIVSIRERRAFFRSRPSWVLISALTADALAGALIGLIGLGELEPLPLAQIGAIAAFALVCSVGPNDLLKVFLIDRLWMGPHLRLHSTSAA